MKDLIKTEAIVLSTDSSNCGRFKLMPVLARFYKKENVAITTKLMDFFEVKSEIAKYYLQRLER